MTSVLDVAMEIKRPTIVTVNGGSSSIKFAVFKGRAPPQRLLTGLVDRIGQSQASLMVCSRDEKGSGAPIAIDASDPEQAAERIADFLCKTLDPTAITGIGHRVVHGGAQLLTHQPITPQLITELRRTLPLDRAHLPLELALIEVLRRRLPACLQVACFDTAFHHEMPPVAKLLPIPRSYSDAGVRRFGFHGLSYTYLMEELRRSAGAEAAGGRVILAHLGSGASMAAVHGGQVVDTTMAFTPTAGLVMGTRPGDLDPGLLIYLMREGRTPEQLDDFINHRCGLLGISGTSGDMRDLLKCRATDPRAAEAVELFCYQARKWIGALTAAMGGLDTLIFAGGIGEHAREVRAEICSGLAFLGCKLDPRRNEASDSVISADGEVVTVRVIRTDEEVVIARIVLGLLERP